MAEVLLRERFGVGSVDRVASAGVHATPGRPATDDAVAAMAHLGLDLSGHRSTPVTAAGIDSADLVVTMESQHLVSLVSGFPDSLARTFTLRELVQLVQRDEVVWSAQRSSPELSPGAERSLRAHLGRRDLDVVDPTGRSRTHHRRCANELAALCDELVAWMQRP
jgi:protein-tyrosine phosphatase